MLLFTITVIGLVAINFILLRFSSSPAIPKIEKQTSCKTESLRQEIQLNVEKRLNEPPITYLKVV